jgi:hypothetical protein
MRREQEPRSYEATLDPQRRAAIQELTALVAQRYPGTSFVVSPGQDDPEATHIIAAVDVADPDEVVDLVIDRMLTLQIEEGIPVHVIPIRTPERVAALLRKQHHLERSEALLPPAQV